MKPKIPAGSVPLFEALEGRQCLSATVTAAPAAAATSTPHHAHHLHTVHHRHTLHTLHTLHAAHVQRRQAHHKHHVHVLHTEHRAHVLRTTVPEPLVLTAQQKSDWPSIRDQVLAERGRVEI